MTATRPGKMIPEFIIRLFLILNLDILDSELIRFVHQLQCTRVVSTSSHTLYFTPPLSLIDLFRQKEASMPPKKV